MSTQQASHAMNIVEEKPKCDFYDKISKMVSPALADSDYKARIGYTEGTIYIFDELSEQDGPALEVNFSVEIEGHIEDFGIGSYEFWGAKGVDTQLGWEIDSIEFDCIFPENMSDIIEKMEEHMAEQACESDFPERDYDDYDY